MTYTASDPVVGGSLFLLGGIVFFAWGVGLHYSQWKLLRDPRRVQGVVEETRIRERAGTDDGTSYYPETRYTYEFDGETYESEGIYPGSTKHGHGTRSDAQATLDDLGLEEGARTTVFVDPSSPGEGFLKAEMTTRSNVLSAVVGLGLICIGASIIGIHLGLVQL